MSDMTFGREDLERLGVNIRVIPGVPNDLWCIAPSNPKDWPENMKAQLRRQYQELRDNTVVKVKITP